MCYATKGIALALGRALRDERRGGIIEWALVAGLTVVGLLAVVGAVGGKVLARWTNTNGGQ